MNINLKELAAPCECGKTHSITLKHMIVDKQAYRHIPEVLSSMGYTKPVCVFDTNTIIVAKEKLFSFIDCDYVVLDAENLHADEEAVTLCLDKLGKQDNDVILAVGSGTIHDISRYVAHKMGVDFVSVPTAASVDGFVSSVAAMTWNGMKKTFEAVAPVAVVADIDIIAQAPFFLTASGVSDLLGKYTSLTDWRILHMLTGEYICERVISLTKKAVDLVADNIDAIAKRDVQGITWLLEGLLLSGLAMQMVGNSRPASGVEHHLSHFWEMSIINPYTKALHGEKVGVGLVIAVGEYEKFLNISADDIVGILPFNEEEVRFTYGKMYEGIKEENTPDPILDINLGKLKSSLDEIKQVVKALPSREKIIQLLKTVSAKTTMEEIYLSDDVIEKSLLFSPYVRRRMTLMRIINSLDIKG